MFGGGGRIRTHGTREGTTVFKTAALSHSATPPQGTLPLIVLHKAGLAGQSLSHPLDFPELRFRGESPRKLLVFIRKVITWRS